MATINEEAVLERLFADVEILKNRIQQTYPNYQLDPNVLFDKLETCQRDDRIDVVFWSLFGPNAIPNVSEPQRIATNRTNDVHTAQQTSETKSTNTVVGSEKKTKRESSQEEIANLNQAVIDTHWTKWGKDALVVDLKNPAPMHSRLNMNMPDALPEPKPSTSTSSVDVFSLKIQEKWHELKAIFPDGAPDYLYQIVQDFVLDDDKLQDCINRMLETKNYPKLHEVIKLQNQMAIKHKYLKGRYVANFDFLTV